MVISCRNRPARATLSLDRPARSVHPQIRLRRKGQRKESFYHMEHIQHKDGGQKKQFFLVISVFYVVIKFLKSLAFIKFFKNISAFPI
jgi:hypothetical protein